MQMDEDLHLVTYWLLCASSQISEEYFRLPVAGSDPRYRERVYCYELYHRWRCHWFNGFQYSLCGEIDKRGHSYVRGKHVDNVKPDFLVHIPGRMINLANLLVMEVKPANADPDQIADDLEKLTGFRRDLKDEGGQPANYYAAYFWVYGLPLEQWHKFCPRVKAALPGKEVDLSLLRFFLHGNPKVRAFEVDWVHL